jgi:hypothetical protein
MKRTDLLPTKQFEALLYQEEMEERVEFITWGPQTKDDCKDDGWATFIFPRTFKNQGDCIQFVNTGK